jgi:glycosyltransferase involved in cell wall biosynthesis
VNRPALSLLLGVPAIADFIPSYEELRDFVPFGDWAKHLQIYANDPELRRRHVRQGRDYLRAKYHPGRVVQQWADAMGRSDSRAAA